MNQLVNLAKLAVESYIRERKMISPPADLPTEFFQRRAGAFVTIEKELQGLPGSERQRALRGCIGTYLPLRQNITEETIYNAIAAASEDYRFGLIQKEELPYLSYTVYILNEPELVKDIKELDAKKFGIIVKTRPIFSSKNLGGQAESDVMFDGHLPSKTGLLLPDLEGVDTVEKQISIACQKGGINLQTEKIIIYKFTVEKHE